MLLIINFISPFLPSPFSVSSNILSTFSRPEAVFYSPQLLGKKLSFEFSYSSDFSNIINRYFFGMQFYHLGFGWYSIRAEEFSEHLLAIGIGYKNLGIGLNIEPQEIVVNEKKETKFYLRGSIGFYRYIEPFWFSVSALYSGSEGRNAGIFSFRYSAKNYDIFIDALLEEGYPLSYMISSIVKVHRNINLILGYNTANTTFNAGIIVYTKLTRVGYQFKTHPFLGNSNSVGIGF